MSVKIMEDNVKALNRLLLLHCSLMNHPIRRQAVQARRHMHIYPLPLCYASSQSNIDEKNPKQANKDETVTKQYCNPTLLCPKL